MLSGSSEAFSFYRQVLLVFLRNNLSRCNLFSRENARENRIKSFLRRYRDLSSTRYHSQAQGRAIDASSVASAGSGYSLSLSLSILEQENNLSRCFGKKPQSESAFLSDYELSIAYESVLALLDHSQFDEMDYVTLSFSVFSIAWKLYK